MFDFLFADVCRMCAHRGARPVGDVKPTHPAQFHVANFQLLHCSHCNVIYLDPPPSPADLDALYCNSEQFTDAHYTDPVQVEKILDYYGNAVRNLRLLSRPGARVLEVGAGLAWVARACKAIDPNVVTVAQDLTAECAEHCPWVDRYCVGSLDALTDEQPFDLASMTHVIEHLVDPAAMLQAIAARLVPDGNLFVTAPYRPTGWNRAQGLAPWLAYSYLHVPAHVSYLSRKWFDIVAPRAGLKVVRWDASHEQDQAFELVLRRC